MSKNFIALGITFGSFLYAAIWTRIAYLGFNYREIDSIIHYFLFIVLPICNYVFGVYIVATIFRLSSKRKTDIEPLVLACSSIFSLLLFLFFSSGFGGNPITIIRISFLLLFQLLSIRTVCSLQINRNTFKTDSLKNINTTLLIHLVLLLAICRNDFPGVNAPIEIRQKWAYETFTQYPNMVKSIAGTNEIIDMVGKIKFVAPTYGRNLNLETGGSSGPYSNLTLEVVGEKGTGIAYIITKWGNVYGMCFKHNAKHIVSKKWGSSSCQN